MHIERTGPPRRPEAYRRVEPVEPATLADDDLDELPDEEGRGADRRNSEKGRDTVEVAPFDKRIVVVGYGAGGRPRSQALTREEAKNMGEGVLKQWERANPAADESEKA